eukprot:14816531-Alexandrium_andersonii.AAC.1
MDSPRWNPLGTSRTALPSSGSESARTTAQNAHLDSFGDQFRARFLDPRGSSSERLKQFYILGSSSSERWWSWRC